MEIRLNLLLFICIFYFCHQFLWSHAAVRPSQNAAIVTNKMLHKNGLKEFTVLKRIKGNDCACACLCTSPDSVDGMAELHRVALPGNQSLDRLIRPPIRYFQIAKEIRANQCKCSCACSEPHDEIVMEFSHNSDNEQHQLNNDVISETWTTSPKQIADEQRSTTLESHQTTISITIADNSSSLNRKTLRDSEDIQLPSTAAPHQFTATQFMGTTIDNNKVATISTRHHLEQTQASESMATLDSSTIQEPTSASQFRTTPSSSPRSSIDNKKASAQSRPTTPSISFGPSTTQDQSRSQSHTTSTSDGSTIANEVLVAHSRITPSISLGSSTVSPSRNAPPSTSSDASSKVEGVPPSPKSREILPTSTVQESTPSSPTTASISHGSSTIEEIHVFTTSKSTTSEKVAQNATNTPTSTSKTTLTIASGNDDGIKTKAENSTIFESTNSKATTYTVINMTESTVRQQITELDATVSSSKSEMAPSAATSIANTNHESQYRIINSSTIHLPSKGFEITKNQTNIGTNSSESMSKITIFELLDSSNNNTVSILSANTNVSSNLTVKKIEHDTSPLPFSEKQQQSIEFSTTILPTTGFKIAKNATQSSPLPTVPSKMSTVLSKQHIVYATASTNTVSDNVINTVSTTVATTESGTIQNTIPTTATNTVSVTMKNLTEILLELPSAPPSAKIGDDKQQNSTKSTTSTTLDPAFKARVANMLNKLKEQLYRLREEEKRKKVVTELEQEHKTNQEQLEKMAETQRTTLATVIANSSTVTNVSKDRLSDYGTVSGNISSKAQVNLATQTTNNTENSNLFTTVLVTNTTVIPDKNDTVASSKIKENTVSSKEKQHAVDSKSNARPTIAPMDMSIDGKAEQMLQQHRQATTVVPKTVIVTHTTVPDTVASGFVIGNGSNSAEDEEEEKGSLEKNSTKNGGNTVKMAEIGEKSTVNVGTEKAEKENSTIKMETTETTTTLSPAFKARVANLLNRLKEQLYKMRELQEAMKEPSNSTVTVEQSTVTVPTVSTTVNSSLSSTMIALEGLQKKMEKENDSKITKNPTNEPKNSLVDSSNEEAPSFITEAPEIELTTTEIIQANSTTNAANISQNLANPTIVTVNAQINQSMDNHINESKNTINDPSDNKLFPLSSDFSQSEDRRNRIILLPPPPQGSALFSSSPAANESTNTSKDILSGESNITEENPHVGLQNAIEQQTTFTENITDVSTTNLPPKMVVSTTTMSTTNTIVGGATRKVPLAIPLTPLAPLAQSMIERLEMARKLREEQVKLEMMEAIRREQLGTDEIDPHLEERRREIEAKLLLLAQTERFHRELLERQQNEQQREATRSKSSDDQQNTAATVSGTDQSPSVNVDALCDPVRRFLRQFRVDDPRRWMARNCRVARRHFPHASCGQIGVLLAKCVEQQKQQHRANIEDDSEEQGEEDRGD